MRLPGSVVAHRAQGVTILVARVARWQNIVLRGQHVVNIGQGQGVNVVGGHHRLLAAIAAIDSRALCSIMQVGSGERAWTLGWSGQLAPASMLTGLTETLAVAAAGVSCF